MDALGPERRLRPRRDDAHALPTCHAKQVQPLLGIGAASPSQQSTQCMQMEKPWRLCCCFPLRDTAERARGARSLGRKPWAASISVRAPCTPRARMACGHMLSTLWEPTNIQEAGSMLSMKQLNSRTALTSDMSSLPMLDPQARKSCVCGDSSRGVLFQEIRANHAKA